MVDFNCVRRERERLKLGGCSRYWECAGPMRSSAHGGRRHAARLQLQRGEQREMARPVRTGAAKGTDPTNTKLSPLVCDFNVQIVYSEFQARRASVFQ